MVVITNVTTNLELDLNLKFRTALRMVDFVDEPLSCESDTKSLLHCHQNCYGWGS